MRVGYAEAITQAHRRPSKALKLDHLQVHEAENGGHLVEHHFQHDGGQYHEPEQHVFAKGEGHKMLAHVAKHMGIKSEAKAEGETVAKEKSEQPEKD